MQSVDQVASSIPELSYTRIHAPLAGEYKLDETSQGALESMVASAHEIFAQHQKTIDAYKLTDLIKVSIELLDDSAFPLEPYIAQEFARAFGIAEEEAFCIGDGSGKPTGLFTGI